MLTWSEGLALGLLASLVVVLLLAARGRRSLRAEAARRDAELAAAQAERDQLRSVLEHSTNLMYSHGVDHVLTFVSPQTRTFLDVEPEEALVRWTEFVTDNPANAVAYERTMQAIATGERQPPYELEMQGRTGRRVWVEVHEAPVVRDGRTVAIVGALTDITERKRSEEAKSRLEAEFRQAQKMDAVGRLAGGIAHDFNNLLGVILGYGELLRRDMVAGDKAERRVGEIVKAAERAAALTRQLLAFSRKQTLDTRVMDLGQVVEDMESMLRRLIREDVQLRVRKPPEPLLIKADRSQLEQVLLNLAVNARDAMPEGGTLSILLDTVQANGSAPVGNVTLPAGPHVRLSVVDTGCGMDADTLARAFEPFFTTKPKGAGSGLGLATVYGIVQQSGGSIDVVSAPRKGTSFAIYFPAVEEALEHAAVTAPAPDPGRETVLLVEDEPSLRQLTRELLEAQGFTVLDAASGPEALCVLGEYEGPIHLLLTDVIMPVMSGRQLAERVAQERPGTPVLYISGYTADVNAPQGVLDPGMNLLEKPFTPEALISRVQQTLKR